MERTRAKWEVDEILFSDEIESSMATLGVVVEVTHPTFYNGNVGEPRLSVVMQRRLSSGKDFVLRFFCPNGEFGEISHIISMLDSMLIKSDEYKQKYHKYLKSWKDQKDEDLQYRISEHDEYVESEKKRMIQEGNKNIGNGLSKYTKNSKTRRKRERYNNVDE